MNKDARNNSMVLLPGNSPMNAKWNEAFEAKLKDYGFKSVSLSYDHWDSDGDIDFKSEALKLKNKSISEDLTVIAKSAGIYVALIAMKEKWIKPSTCVFLGLPLPWLESKGIEIGKAIKAIDAKLLFIQQKEDPFTSATALNKYLNTLGVIFSIESIPGNDHSYLPIEQTMQLIIDFTK